MTNNISLGDVQQELGQVMHPAISRSLVELGMVKDVALKHDVVTLTLVLPALNIPASIKDHLVNSLRTAVAKLGAEVEVEITEMDEEERHTFLSYQECEFPHHGCEKNGVRITSRRSIKSSRH